jgi:translation initiation factor IF-1
VELQNGHKVLGHISGKIRKNYGHLDLDHQARQQ